MGSFSWHDAKARGLCPQCQKRPPDQPRRVCCSGCLAQARGGRPATRRWGALPVAPPGRRDIVLHELGLCARCGQRPPEPQRRLCRGCLDYKKKRARLEREAQIGAGLCAVGACRTAVAGRFRICLEHRTQAAQRRSGYRAEHRICGLCNQPSGEALKNHRACLDALAARRKAKSEQHQLLGGGQ